MSGNSFDAGCSCGFSRELEPGTDETEGFKDRVMAYSANRSDIETADREAAESAGLKIIEDPCLFESLEEMVKPFDFDKAYGPYLCPQCRGNSLYLRLTGAWD
jgi:hypothetical protein